MTSVQMNLASLLLWAGALPLWSFLTLAVARSPGFTLLGYFVATVTLVLATAAIYRLFRDSKNGLAISAMLAGMVLTGALLIVAAVSRYS